MTDGGVELTVEAVESGGETQTIQADYCLVATGVSPVLPEISDKLGKLELSDKNSVQVDDRYHPKISRARSDRTTSPSDSRR